MYHYLSTPLFIAEEDEVVDVIVYLLSEKSSMVHGIVMPVDGGFTV
jgi:NAD(P)-dependent dehydrogenase (short-subunit alcohol dehydrogenase family)